MIRQVAAFVWLRWRIALNGMTRSSKRDWVEQISRVIAVVVPIVALLMTLPGLLLASVASVWAGITFASAPPVEVARGHLLFWPRVLFLIFSVMLVVSPLVRAGQDRDTGFTRLLLLPLRRVGLFAADVLAGFGDVFLALLVAPALGVPLGLALGGKVGTAVIVLAAGLLFVGTLALVKSGCVMALAVLLRRRRRAEWLTIAFMAVLGTAFLLPAAFDDGVIHVEVDEQAQRAASGNADRVLDALLPVWTRALPSELYVKAAAGAAAGDTRGALARLGGLALWCAVVTAAAWRTYCFLLQNPGQEGATRRGGPVTSVDRSLPLVRPATAAVALAALRLALRTVRGRLAVFLNFPMVGLSLLMFTRQGRWELPEHPLLQWGLLGSLAGYWVTSISLQALFANQFAVDGPGLVREVLAPFDSQQLVRGKLVAYGLLVGASTLACSLTAWLVDPAGSWWLWLLLIPICVSSLAVVAPCLTLLSALLPKSVDLSRLGKQGNPHGMAGFLGFLLTLVTLAVSVAVIAVLPWLSRGGWTAHWGAAALWLLLSVAVGRGMLQLAVLAFDRRRENLLLVASGR